MVRVNDDGAYYAEADRILSGAGGDPKPLPTLPAGWPHTNAPDGVVPGRRFSREPTCRPPQRVNWIKHRQKFEEMWREKVGVEEMADFFECSTATIYGKASQWKLGRRFPLHGPRKHGKVTKTSRIRADPTGQRRKMRLSASSGPKIVLEPHDPRYRAGTTVFPTSVVPASRLPRLLKSGHNSYKIGRMAEKGRWRGMPIFTLTLEERATCPRSCRVWASCYGNNMPFAHRIHDDGTLTKRLWGELAALSAEHAAGFVVRLHVLGDFFSLDYVRFWRQCLIDFPPLRVFGFTARRPDDPIGAALICLVRDYQDRFALRFSGAGYETHSSEVVDRAEDAIGIVCPAELDETRSCATCGLCWTSTRSITFLRH